MLTPIDEIYFCGMLTNHYRHRLHTPVTKNIDGFDQKDERVKTFFSLGPLAYKIVQVVINIIHILQRNFDNKTGV